MLKYLSSNNERSFNSWNVSYSYSLIVSYFEVFVRLKIQINDDSDILQFYTYEFWEFEINNYNGYSQYQNYSHCHRILQINNTGLGRVWNFILKTTVYFKFISLLVIF